MNQVDNENLLETDQSLQNQRKKTEANGIIFMACSSFAYSINSLFVKLGSKYFSSFFIVLGRSVFQLGFGITVSLYLGIPVFGPRHLRKWLWLRGTLGCLGLALYYYSITVLPLADATTLFFTGPMFTSVAASVLLGEPFEMLDFIGLSLCLVGVTLLSKPTWLVGVDNSLHLTAEEAYKRTLGVSAAILGEIMASLAYLTVRKLGTKVHFLNHVTYLGICSSIFSFIMSYKLDQLVPLGFTKSTFILLTIGITACTGQCLLNSGLQIAPMGPGSLMRNLDVVFAFIFGITIFHEIPDFYSIAGALLIVGCAVSIGLRKILRSKT